MSTYLTMNESCLRDVQGAFTAKEIAHQPLMWRQAFHNIQEERAKLDQFLDPLLAKKNVRIILTGAGTSAFAGKVIGPHLSKRTGQRFDAISTTDIVASPAEYLAEQVPTLMVSFARSGNSPESVAAVALADQMLDECHHLMVTCNPEGHLAKVSQQRDDVFCLLMPQGTNDQSFAMTSSFTSMMLSVICAFDGQAGMEDEVFHIAALTQSLLESQIESMKMLAEKPCDRVVFLGSGCFQGLAQEAALKLLELTAGKVMVSYDTPLGFRHGPKSMVDENTLIFHFMGQDEHAQQYDQDLFRELQRDNQAHHLVVITCQPMPASDYTTSISIGKLKISENVWLSFPFITLAQVFAFFKSVHLGITPDNPCPTGEVNRVVQGVTIHPYKK